MNVPDNLRYTADHEWVREEGNRWRVGITDYAQDALGDVVFVQLPEPGTELQAGVSFSEVESTKSVSDIYAPVSGTVIEVNEDLPESPGVVNEDPYGDGWLIKVRVSDPTDFDDLMESEEYEEIVASEKEE
jgi:glycine cleavage system H protein